MISCQNETGLFSMSAGRRALLFASSAILLATIAGHPAAAQNTAAQSDQQAADDEELEQIVVTGSRIRRSPLETPQPVMTLTAEDIDKTGQVSLGEFLQRLPVAGSAINRANNSSGNLGFPPDGGGIGAGASEIDLRYLGSKRTLVLVDGRRWIKGSSASGVSGAVDLNTIPVNVIDRIEVLQDGASTIYGSDAIGGVVNVITKNAYDGFEVSAYGGTFLNKGDGTSQEYTFRWGASGENTRVMLAASFTDQGKVFAGDRKISQFPIAGITDGTGGSSGTPQGRFIFTDPRTGETLSITLNDGALNDGGANKPAFDPLDPFGGDFHPFTTADRFNFQPFNLLLTPNKRVNIFGKAEVDVTDRIVFEMKAAYNNRRSVNQAAPEPLFMGSDAGAGFFLDNIFIPADHPFNPFGIDLNGGGSDPNLILIGRRPIEAGPRIFKQNVDTWVLSGTLSGEVDFAGRTVYWDFNATWAQNQANQRKFGAFNARKLALALGPVDECAAVPGCVPFNIFGGQGPNGQGSITQEMLDFVTFVQKDESEQRFFDVTFNVTGDMFDLPAGPLGYAFGYEHRKEQGFFTPDSVVSSGETAGVPASPTEGQFNVDEVYGEVNIPLVADLPFMRLLEANGSFRVSDYNTSGSKTVFKFGGDWRVNDDLLIRGTWSEGFRAPGIGELFNSGSRFDSTINDPCSDATGQTLANCQALGVPAGFTQINPQISVNTGGNPNLQPETSNTWTAGFAFSPDWFGEGSGFESLVVEANYYNIDLKNAIQALNAQDQLDQCVATLDPLFCSGIERGPGGSIIRFENQLTNIGRIKTDGIDWSVILTSEQFDVGQFRLSWLNTWLDSYKEFTLGPSGTLVPNERAGTELGSPERGFVEYKSTLALDWFYREFSVNFLLRYMSSLKETCPFDGSLGSLCSDAANGVNKIGSRLYGDLTVTWTPHIWKGDWALSVGVNNLFDTSTPICYSCDLNSFDGTLYPIPGPFGWVRLTWRR
ncbi:MAG: TonB-dependent receptor [Alphaproteobacteria bacterium]|nr:MAG: TonB-dependent receptor [Alphaproteobacteria bacterium]